MRKFIVAAGLLAAAFFSGAEQTSAQALTAESKGSITFDAPTYGTVVEMHADKPGAMGKAAFFLSLPDGAGPFPAVMISHTVGGWSDLVEGAAVKMLLAQGYAVAALDHFGPRGIKPPLKPGVFSTPAATSDALLGLKLLATHPRIDPKRIALVGYSMGGTAAQLAAYEFLAERHAGAGGPRFAAHVSQYGTLVAVAMNGPKTMTGAPVLLLAGGKDETSPAAKLQQIIALVQAVQPAAPIELVTYPGAHHAWNNPRMTRQQAGGFHSGACPLFDLGARFGMIAADGSRQDYSPQAAVACTRAGGKYTMMYDEAATKQADAAMLAFLAKHLKGNS